MGKLNQDENAEQEHSDRKHSHFSRYSRISRSTAKNRNDTVELMNSVRALTRVIADATLVVHDHHKITLGTLANALDMAVALSKKLASEQQCNLIDKHNEIQRLRSEAHKSDDPENIMKLLKKSNNLMTQLDTAADDLDKAESIGIEEPSFENLLGHHPDFDFETARPEPQSQEHDFIETKDVIETVQNESDSYKGHDFIETEKIDHDEKDTTNDDKRVEADCDDYDKKTITKIRDHGQSMNRRGSTKRRGGVLTELVNGVPLLESAKRLPIETSLGNREASIPISQTQQRPVLSISIGDEQSKEKMTIAIPEVPVVSSTRIHGNDPISDTVKPVLSAAQKTQVAKFLLENFDRDNNESAIGDVCDILSTKYDKVNVYTVRKWLTKQRKINRGEEEATCMHDKKGRPREIMLCDFAEMETDIVNRGFDVNVPILEKMMMTARDKTNKRRNQGGSTKPMSVASRKRNLQMALLSMKSTQKTQWGSKNREIANRSPRNFVGTAAGMKAAVSGAIPEWGVTAEQARKHPVSSHLLMNHDQTGYQLYGTNGPNDEVWFKHIDDVRPFKELGASSKGQANCLTQQVKVHLDYCYLFQCLL